MEDQRVTQGVQELSAVGPKETRHIPDAHDQLCFGAQ